MRLVRLLKDITQKSQVKLNDAWQGKWKETSKDLHMYFNWYKKGIRMPCVEFWFDKFETPEGQEFGRNGFESNGLWGEDGETVKEMYSANASCIKYWFTLFETPRGRSMGENGFYGQWGFVYDDEHRSEMTANLNSGDITILDQSCRLKIHLEYNKFINHVFHLSQKRRRRRKDRTTWSQLSRQYSSGFIRHADAKYWVNTTRVWTGKR